jgi:hypothetical protein
MDSPPSPPPGAITEGSPLAKHTTWNVVAGDTAAGSTPVPSADDRDGGRRSLLTKRQRRASPGHHLEGWALAGHAALKAVAGDTAAGSIPVPSARTPIIHNVVADTPAMVF